MAESSARVQRGYIIPHMEAWRRYRVLTQRELAALAGVARSTVTRAEEGGAISAANVRKLAHALEVTVHELLREEPTS